MKPLIAHAVLAAGKVMHRISGILLEKTGICAVIDIMDSACRWRCAMRTGPSLRLGRTGLPFRIVGSDLCKDPLFPRMRQ